MHEYGLAEGVLATVRQRAGGRKVAGIRVRFGVKHAVVEESLAQAWVFVAAGTEAEGSAVTLLTVPATLSLSLGAFPAFGPFVPGVANSYTITAPATVTSTAGDVRTGPTTTTTTMGPDRPPSRPVHARFAARLFGSLFQFLDLVE